MIIVKIMKTDETIGMDRTVWGGRGGLLYNCAGGPLSHSPSIYQQSQLLFPFTVFEVTLCGHKPAPAWNTLRAHCSSSYVQQSAPEGGNLILAQACFSLEKMQFLANNIDSNGQLDDLWKYIKVKTHCWLLSPQLPREKWGQASFKARRLSRVARFRNVEL